jgi:nitric oxide dioxygenase
LAAHANEAAGLEESMTLTTAQISLIRDSFRRLQSDPGSNAELFYQHLFRIAPELRPMFRSDMTGQGMRFMSTLALIVQHLDDPQELRPYLEKLAQGHAAFGVKHEHFHPMGQALIQTMRDTLETTFPADADAAWEAAYDLLADEMVALSG